MQSIQTRAIPEPVAPQVNERTKLYVVVRNNLSPGAKACQAAHALRAYADTYPFIESFWWRHSNTLVMLEASEEQLLGLEVTAHQKRISCVRFVEPDWSPAGDLTALVIGPDGKRLVADLPLAYRS